MVIEIQAPQLYVDLRDAKDYYWFTNRSEKAYKKWIQKTKVFHAFQGVCQHDFTYTESGEKRICKKCIEKERRGRWEKDKWFCSGWIAPPDGYENIKIILPTKKWVIESKPNEKIIEMKKEYIAELIKKKSIENPIYSNEFWDDYSRLRFT